MMLTNGWLSAIVANGLQANMVRRKAENLQTKPPGEQVLPFDPSG